MDATAQISVTGLAAMGRNLARHGLTVAVHNRSESRTRDLVDGFGDEGGEPSAPKRGNGLTFPQVKR